MNFPPYYNFEISKYCSSVEMYEHPTNPTGEPKTTHISITEDNALELVEEILTRIEGYNDLD